MAADRNQVVTRAQELVRLVSEILACYRPLRLQLEKTASPALADSHRDIEQQLTALLAPGFITGRWQQRVGFEWALGFSAESEKLVDGRWIKPTDMHGSIGLPAATPGIAKMLKSAGYATGAFGNWHLGVADE